MNGQRFVNMMLACNLPRQENLTGPALRVIATAAARGHVKKQEYDNGHTATRIYKAGFSAETMGRVTTHGRKLSYEDFLNALMRVRGNLLLVTNWIASVDCVFGWEDEIVLFVAKSGKHWSLARPLCVLLGFIVIETLFGSVVGFFPSVWAW